MRLWSLNPGYLDPPGLVALWREGLLAKAVLEGKTLGYRHHPQLVRFRRHPNPKAAIRSYLHAVFTEAESRGYSFNRRKAGRLEFVDPILVTRGQLLFEWKHLEMKVRERKRGVRFSLPAYREHGHPACHPLFIVKGGGVEPWEKLAENGMETA